MFAPETRWITFRRDDEEEFIIHNMILEGTQHEGCFQEDAPEDDGNQYLNDTGDGDANHLQEMAVKDIGAEVYEIRAHMSKHDMNYLCM